MLPSYGQEISMLVSARSSFTKMLRVPSVDTVTYVKVGVEVQPSGIAQLEGLNN